MIGTCGTCGRDADSNASNQGYSDCCNDRIEYGDEAEATKAEIAREKDESVTVELPMYAPEALPVQPTNSVRWWPLPSAARAYPAGVVSGRLSDVAAFVRAHWGDDEIDSHDGGVQAWAQANRYPIG
jgi:hypothetical protein